MNEEAPQTAIIADDEEHIRFFLKSVLKRCGISVVGEAVNGAEAVELYEKNNPTLVMLDINMPVKTGKDALVDIMTKYPDAVAIMLTSVSDMATVEQCIELGASNYIRKDTPVEELQTIIKETLAS